LTTERDLTREESRFESFLLLLFRERQGDYELLRFRPIRHDAFEVRDKLSSFLFLFFLCSRSRLRTTTAPLLHGGRLRYLLPADAGSFRDDLVKQVRRFSH